MRLLREGRKNEALLAFRKVVRKRERAPESHLEIGRLYTDHLDDPAGAIYHYQMYLESNADSRQAVRVRQLIDSAKKQFIAQLPGEPFKSDLNRLELLESLEEAHNEKIQLEQKLKNARQHIKHLEQKQVASHFSYKPVHYSPSIESQTTEIDIDQKLKPQTTIKTYKVTEGDTLTKISLKLYGKSSEWMEIFEENRDTMNSPHALHVGQILRIPNL